MRLARLLLPTGMDRLMADLKEAGRLATSSRLEVAAWFRSRCLTSEERERERDRLKARFGLLDGFSLDEDRWRSLFLSSSFESPLTITSSRPRYS